LIKFEVAFTFTTSPLFRKGLPFFDPNIRKLYKSTFLFVPSLEIISIDLRLAFSLSLPADLIAN